MDLTPEAMAEALNAISAEAEKLSMIDKLPDEIKEGLERIIAIANYGFDIRTDDEQEAAGGEPSAGG